MSELTLFLIRVAYLAILWIFVLSADLGDPLRHVRRPGARRPRRGGERRGKSARSSQPPKRRRGAPTHVLVTEGANSGERADLDQAPILIGRGSDAAIRLDDDYVSTRHARIAASGDQWFVEDLGSTNGTYIGSVRHHPAHDRHARHPGPDRQDHPRAAEVVPMTEPTTEPTPEPAPGPTDGPSGTSGASGQLRLDYAAISDVGRVRKDNQDSGYAGPWLLAVCDGVGGAARGDIASATADPAAAPARPAAERATSSGRSPGPCTAPTTGSPSSSTRTRRSTAPAPPPRWRSSTASDWGSATSGDSRAYLYRDRRDHPAHQGPHLRPEPHRRGPDHRGGGAGAPAPQPHPQGPRRHPRGRAGPLPHRPGRRRPAAAVQRRRLAGCSTTAGSPTSSATGSPDFAAVELVRASLEAGSSDNVTCLVADVRRRTAPRAADAPAAAWSAPPPSCASAPGPARAACSAATAPATPASSSRSPPRSPTRSRSRSPADPLDPEEVRYAPRPPHRFTWLRGCWRCWSLVGLVWVAAAGRLVVEPAAVLRRRAGREGRDLPRPRTPTLPGIDAVHAVRDQRRRARPGSPTSTPARSARASTSAASTTRAPRRASKPRGLSRRDTDTRTGADRCPRSRSRAPAALIGLRAPPPPGRGAVPARARAGRRHRRLRRGRPRRRGRGAGRHRRVRRLAGRCW